MFHFLSRWPQSKRATGTERIGFPVERKFTIQSRRNEQRPNDSAMFELPKLNLYLRAGERSLEQNASPVWSLSEQTENHFGQTELQNCAVQLWQFETRLLFSHPHVLKPPKYTKFRMRKEIRKTRIHCRHLTLDVNIKYQWSYIRNMSKLCLNVNRVKRKPF